jgi:hypothetical protein
LDPRSGVWRLARRMNRNEPRRHFESLRTYRRKVEQISSLRMF